MAGLMFLVVVVDSGGRRGGVLLPDRVSQAGLWYREALDAGAGCERCRSQDRKRCQRCRSDQARDTDQFQYRRRRAINYHDQVMP